MSYSATVSSGNSWLRITSGSSGGNSGTIGISYDADTGAQRSGTIVLTANGASGSPVTLTITQASGSSLVAYYRFEGNASDDSGNGLNGTVRNASFSSGYAGSGLNVSSIDSFVEVPNNP